MLKIVDKVLKYMIPDSTWHLDDPNGVYLTFDDGPTPGVTEWILATLAK
jgi:peptidoglycan/xylan/chitin deacetylase (PgdA/CDA1 family)